MKIAYVPKNFRGSSLDVIERANEILEAYEAQGYDLTLRQLYYQFVARGLIPNRDAEYKKLGSLVNDGRLAGLIDWEHIVDRTRNLRSISHWDDPNEIIASAASSFRIDKWAEQPVRLEVWIEKDALVGVIERPCSELDVPYFSCRGYTSQSEMWAAAMRLYQYIENGQRVEILHFGDHDPSGLDMSRDIEERVLLFLSHHLGFSRATASFRLERLALNMDQVEQYDPPPNPAKLTDSRGFGYVVEYGNESWELDALEPTVIGELIGDAVAARRADDAWNEAVAVEDEHRGKLATASRRWTEVAAFLNGSGS